MAIKDSSEPATPSTSTTAGSVALLPEPFEVNERAVSLAAKAARDVLQRMSTGGLRRARREASAPAPAAATIIAEEAELR